MFKTCLKKSNFVWLQTNLYLGFTRCILIMLINHLIVKWNAMFNIHEVSNDDINNSFISKCVIILLKLTKKETVKNNLFINLNSTPTDRFVN